MIGVLLKMLVDCANVKTAIDNLVTVINDVIAPTGNDYNVAADRLYFNRQYLMLKKQLVN